MMNGTLFLYDIRQNRIMFVLILAISLMYFTVICGMYDPAGNEELARLASMKMSPQMLKAFGFEIEASTALTPFLSAYLYGMLMLILPIVYSNTVASRLLAQHTDRGSMVFLLSSPVSRRSIALTQAVFLWSSMFLMILSVTVYAVFLCRIKFPGLLDTGNFMLLNLGLVCLMTLISGIGFAASSFFSRSGVAMATGLGIPLFFYIVKMAGDASESLSWLRNFTPFSLFDNVSIASGEIEGISLAVMAVSGLLLYFAGVFYFCRKDISV